MLVSALSEAGATQVKSLSDWKTALEILRTMAGTSGPGGNMRKMQTTQAGRSTLDAIDRALSQQMQAWATGVVEKHIGKTTETFDPSEAKSDLTQLLSAKDVANATAKSIGKANAEPEEAAAAEAGEDAKKSADRLVDLISTYYDLLSEDGARSIAVTPIHVLNTGPATAVTFHFDAPKNLGRKGKTETITSTEGEDGKKSSEEVPARWRNKGKWGMHAGYALENVDWDDGSKKDNAWIVGFNYNVGEHVYLDVGWAQSIRNSSENGVYFGLSIRADRLFGLFKPKAAKVQ